jgi:hypothetical protein
MYRNIFIIVNTNIFNILLLLFSVENMGGIANSNVE